MKKKIKTIGIILGIVIIILSICFNVYFIGWKRMERKFYSAGVNNTISLILSQIQQTGQVIINTEKGQVILVPRVEQFQQIIPNEK